MIVYITVLFSLSVLIGGLYAQIAIFASHLFALYPLSITLKYDCRWLTVFLVSSILVSLLWHCSQLWFYNIKFLQLDVIHQNLLIAVSIALIIFDRVPQYMLGILLSYTIFLSVFCLDTVDHVSIYLIFSGCWVLALMFHILYELIHKKYYPTYDLIMLFMYASIAVSLYTLAPVNYNVIHSIWHVCAYSTLYFSFKISICRERIDFE